MAILDGDNLNRLCTARVPILKLCTLILGYLVIQVGWHAIYGAQFYQTNYATSTDRNTCMKLTAELIEELVAKECPELTTTERTTTERRATLPEKDFPEELNTTTELPAKLLAELPAERRAEYQYYRCREEYIAEYRASFETCSLTSYYLEIVFQTFTIFCFLLSIISFAGGFICVVNPRTPLQWIHLIIHVVGGLLLIISGCLMITSPTSIANSRCGEVCQKWIDNLTNELKPGYYFDRITKPNQLDKFTDKIVAGVFCLLNGILYLITAVIILKTSGGGRVNPSGWEMSPPGAMEGPPADVVMVNEPPPPSETSLMSVTESGNASSRPSEADHHHGHHHHKDKKTDGEPAAEVQVEGSSHHQHHHHKK